MTLAPSAPPPLPASTPPDQPARRRTAADWLAALGNVPLDRIVFDPLPGTVTPEHYARLDGRVDGRPVELVEGNLVEKAMGMFEDAVGAVIIGLLRTYVAENKFGIVLGSQGMTRMAGGNIRMPDAAVVAEADLDRELLRKEAAPQFRPTLCVEVVSDGNTQAEMDLKLRDYFESGCRTAWLVYPAARLVRVYDAPDRFRQLTADDTLDGGDVLPGFSVKVTELFDV